MRRKSALISGAGIAGSTLAYWLVRSGWDVTVVEKAAGARSSGNPVDVRGAASAIAQAMGIWPALVAAATGVSRLVLVDGAGRRRASIGTRQNVRADDEVEVARSDLAAALVASVAADVEILRGDSLRGLHQDGGGVDVRFVRSSERRFDLVFGADGLHSALRGLVFGAESEYSRAFGMYVGTVRTELDAGDPREVVMLNRPGRSVAIHPAGGKPVAAFIFRHRGLIDPRDSAAGKRVIQQVYADDRWATPQVLQEFQASDDVYFDTVTRIVMPEWSCGRVTLLGDAASCISLFGEGSSNAIVAAKTLADALDGHSGDHRAGFAAYEQEHRRRLRGFQRGARAGSHFLVPATASGIALRNAAIRMGALFGR